METEKLTPESPAFERIVAARMAQALREWADDAEHQLWRDDTDAVEVCVADARARAEQIEKGDDRG